MTVSYGAPYCIPNPEVVFQTNLTFFLLDCLGIPAEGSERTGHTSANSVGGVLPPIDNTYYYTPPASASRLAGGNNPNHLPPPPLSNAASTSTIWSLARLTSLQQGSATAAVPGAEMAAFSPTDPGQQPLLVNGNAIDLQLKVGRVISCGMAGGGVC